jgi:hypothetical protein
MSAILGVKVTGILQVDHLLEANVRFSVTYNPADLFFWVRVRGAGGMLPLQRIPPDLNLRNKLSQQQKWPLRSPGQL